MKSYRCKKINSINFPALGKSGNEIWNYADGTYFVDVVTGADPGLQTEFKMLYDVDALYLRFVCRDDYWISEFTDRDAPIYKNDVVEFFVSEKDVYHYLEFEQSPKNVLFDADVIYRGPKNIVVKTEWNAENWETLVFSDEKNELMYYEWKLPFSSLGFKIPDTGVEWKFNAYRIDRGKNGLDEFTSFSPTGELNFHAPESFVSLYFD